MTKSDYLYGLLPIWIGSLVIAILSTEFAKDYQVHISLEGFIAIINLIITLLGITIAILFAICISIYVQSRSTRGIGFGKFSSSLFDYTELIRELQVNLNETLTVKPKGYDGWSAQVASLMKKLHFLTPSWPSKRADSSLYCQLHRYALRFQELSDSLGADFAASKYPIRHDQNLKGVLLGLLTMDEAREGYMLSMRLMMVLSSFTSLLALCSIARIIAELRLGFMPENIAVLVNVFSISSLFTALILHMFMSILIIFHWQNEVQKRDKAWSPAP